MSMFENDKYQWRETYFVLFEAAKRPTLDALQKAVASLGEHLEMTFPSADDQGRFESLSVMSLEDCAALDICYLEGEEVIEQTATLVEEFECSQCTADEEVQLKRVQACDARIDILHFEQRSASGDPNEVEEMYDPSALLIVLEALVKLCGGIAVDPQSGTIM